MTPDEFIDFFCEYMRITPETEITRIEFEHLEPTNEINNY